jgi:lysophospholipid acyltransferase (LPLAT)-like uncharacterized protein
MPSLSSRVLWTVADWPLAALIWVYAQTVLRTSQVRVEGEVPAGAAVLVNFHHHQPMMQAIHGHQGRWMMVSPAPPLWPVARYARWMGLRLARGATGDGGRAALRELTEALRRGEAVSIAVDGPAGPVGKVKRGCVELAQATGAPIVPVAYECARGVKTWRWDRALFPTPFDRNVVRYGPPLDVRGLALPEAQRRVEEAMLRHAPPPGPTAPGPAAPPG